MADKEKRRLRATDLPFVEKALRRHLRRPPAPDVEVAQVGDDWRYSSPYDGQEHEWEVLLFNAFGTRSRGTFRVFIDQLVSLCRTTYDPDSGQWRPDHNELTALINIVNATRPRNELEACLAAQIAAVHLMSMKLAKQSMHGSYVDERTAATTARMFKASAALNDALLKMKGRKVHRQSIKVSHEKHIHQHHHQHIHAGGGSQESGAQPPANVTAAHVPALSSQDPTGEVLPFPSGHGEAGVPNARRIKSRRSQG